MKDAIKHGHEKKKMKKLCFNIRKPGFLFLFTFKLKILVGWIILLMSVTRNS